MRLNALWRRLSRVPGGKLVFSLLIGRLVPYSGSVRPRVLDLAPGWARVAMHDRRAVRNHLRSVHAIALMNVAELASGLAMLTGLPPTLRGIVRALDMEYLKKARGLLIAECVCDVNGLKPGEVVLASIVRDAAGDVVARAAVHWTLGVASPR
ncbi:MAG: hypothetical protein NVS4B3_20500 [Gemmatimonadaceae bacterium]